MCLKHSGPLSMHAGLLQGPSATSAALNTAPGRAEQWCDPQRPASHIPWLPPQSICSWLHHPPPLKTLSLFNQDEILTAITAFQGLHTYICRLLIHSQTFLPVLSHTLSSHLITLLCSSPPSLHLPLCNLTPLLTLYPLFSPSI